jgi:Bacterial SH3 domain
MVWRGVVLAALLAPAAAVAARADVVEVTGWQVNVRERPSRSGHVLVTLYRGERFALLERVGSWYHVRMVPSGREGYVHSSLVRVIPGATLVAPEPEVPRPGVRPAPTPTPPPAPAPTLPPAPAALAPPPGAAYPPPPVSPAPMVRDTPQTQPDVNSQEREGFWIGLGGGYGLASVSIDGSSGGDREGSFTGFLKLGGTLNQQVLLGVESNAWVKTQDDVTVTLGSVAGTLTFYPKATSGFFLKGGVGLSYISTEVAVAETRLTVSKSGWGVLAGLGYDLRVGRKISITPSFNFYSGRPGDISVEGELVLPGWRQNVLDFGLGVTFH